MENNDDDDGDDDDDDDDDGNSVPAHRAMPSLVGGLVGLGGLVCWWVGGLVGGWVWCGCLMMKEIVNEKVWGFCCKSFCSCLS
jgi:hypothetical protein